METLNLICIIFLAIVVTISSIYHDLENRKLKKEIKRLNEDNKALKSEVKDLTMDYKGLEDELSYSKIKREKDYESKIVGSSGNRP